MVTMERRGRSESLQVASQLGSENRPSCGDGGRAVVHDRCVVDYPQSVDYNRVSSLKTETKTPTKDRRVGGPGESSLLKRDRIRERKERAEFLPETLCQWT